jgi:cyclase
MLRTRVIPALLVQNGCLVKTVRFGRFVYVGDPCNTVRIFNELEVDELFIFDINASRKKQKPDFKLIADIANECFMPLGYGGGIDSLDQAKILFDIGVEKLAINTAAIEKPSLINQIAEKYGSQAVVVPIDVRKNIFGKNSVYIRGGKKNTKLDPISWAKEIEKRGAGEIFLTSIDREGTWNGFDYELVKRVTDSVSIPVIAHGGAGSLKHIEKVVRESNASAVALGSMVVFQKKGMGVLVNFPSQKSLNEIVG